VFYAGILVCHAANICTRTRISVETIKCNNLVAQNDT